MTFNKFALTLVSLSMLGCSSESISINETPRNVPETTSIGEIRGGTALSPARLSRGANFLIDIDPSVNYFTVNIEPGDSVFVNANLDYIVTQNEVDQCNFASSPTQGITIFNGQSYHHSCGLDLAYYSQSGGAYTIFVHYPNNLGSFVYAIDGDETTDRLRSENGNGGTPDQPRQVLAGKEYPVFFRNFFNYYWYKGVAGETIVINQFLFNSYSPRAEFDCINDSQSFGVEQFTQYGISLNNRAHSCNDSVSYTFQRDENLLIHFKTIENTSGFFTLASNR